MFQTPAKLLFLRRKFLPQSGSKLKASIQNTDLIISYFKHKAVPYTCYSRRMYIVSWQQKQEKSVRYLKFSWFWKLRWRC